MVMVCVIAAVCSCSLQEMGVSSGGGCVLMYGHGGLQITVLCQFVDFG